MRIDRPGVFDLSDEQYHADPAPLPSLSSGLVRQIINRSPLHAWTACPRLNPDFAPRQSDAFDVGRAAHTMLLGKGAGIAVIDADDWRSKDARAERDAARAAGKTPMLVAQFEAANALVTAARRQLGAFGIDLLPVERNELAAFAQIDGIWCRALVDHAPADPRRPLVDLKTCEDASPDACIKSVTSYGYAAQAAHYQDVWEAATGERRGFRFAFIEKAPPFGVSVIKLHDDEADDADWMLDARHQCAEARRIWGECLRTGQWPGYPPRVAVVGAPAFYRQKWADKAPIAPAPTRAAMEAARQMMAPHGDAA
ncbi:PD-(D/E)XK nuclease-like domain-containing protein [Amaricoccus solimangrovi]|uniref:Putative exodeoxyribonuclease 8 PDDEXK-like domain-containing protein n=1 Tax=Amaricoccus solimangrovi TaxID=2589815 RepID=A0A501WTJ5_9RHOB|nr:PD-(D/E)XK nuclease-like domain-containing protein [Amaricoccus solimangrovi]TPE53053.1 hypothetical protein FJM51_03235 [Amaricoccus solimangrovi]